MTGAGLPTRSTAEAAAAPVELSDDARQFIRLEQATGTWPIPADLEKAQHAFADALVAGDDAALSSLLVPDLTLDASVSALLRCASYSHHATVAFARLGNQRLLKTRLDGPAGSATVLARWISSADGWRIAALDVVARDAGRPA